MNISPQTAALARHAMDVVLRRTRHNGLPMPPHIRRALDELEAAVDVSPSRQNWTATPAPNVELLSTRQAATRLGVSTRTVERRAASGLLPANRVGRTLQIVWMTEGTEMTSQPKPAQAPAQYRVTGELITVKTGALAGIVPGRGGYVFVSLYRGSILPADVPEDSIKHHLQQGLIEEVAA